MTSLKEFMHDLIAPGETILVAGRRGHGKTATTVSIAQHAMNGDYGHENVVLITNVVFGRVVGHGQPPAEDYPPGVYHEDTLAGTMRRAGEVIKEYGPGGCTIIWMLDEAQNYMMADQNNSKENMALVKYLGNARKFDMVNMFMTPTINNLAPRVRCFPEGEGKSGYCSAQLLKNKEMGAKVASYGMDPRSITFVRTKPDEDMVPIYIAPMPWIQSIYGSLPVGSYGYDTKSMATFDIGQNESGVPFSFEEFLKITSKGLSHELPDKIDEYFSKWDSTGKDGSSVEGTLPGEDWTTIRISEQCRRIGRYRASGMKWKDIAFYEGEIETTLKSRFQKYENAQRVPTFISTNIDNDEDESHERVAIQPIKGEGEGASEPLGGE